MLKVYTIGHPYFDYERRPTNKYAYIHKEINPYTVYMHHQYTSFKVNEWDLYEFYLNIILLILFEKYTNFDELL